MKNNLIPLLKQLKKEVSPDKEWKYKTRNMLLEADREAQYSFWEEFTNMFSFTKTAGALVGILLFLLIPTAVLSKQSLPGSPLYPIKRLIENAQLLLTPDKNVKITIFRVLLSFDFNDIIAKFMDIIAMNTHIPRRTDIYTTAI